MKAYKFVPHMILFAALSALRDMGLPVWAVIGIAGGLFIVSLVLLVKGDGDASGQN